MTAMRTLYLSTMLLAASGTWIGVSMGRALTPASRPPTPPPVMQCVFEPMADGIAIDCFFQGEPEEDGAFHRRPAPAKPITDEHIGA
jgi:hypothetical protein